MVLRQITLIKFKTGVSDQQIKELSVGFSKIANIVKQYTNMIKTLTGIAG